MATNTNDAITQLNSFLRGEISAVETYDQAIGTLKSSQNAAMLQQWKQSHETRVNLLRQQVSQLGGQPADGSGPWGAFAKLVEAGAAALGEKAAISALEEGEDHGLHDYQSDIAKLDDATKAFIIEKIMPEQKKTHDGVRDLKKQLAAS